MNNIKDILSPFVQKKFMVIDVNNYRANILVVHQKGKKYKIINTLTLHDTEKFYKNEELIDYKGLINEITNLLTVNKIKTKEILFTFFTRRIKNKIVDFPDIKEDDLAKVFNNEIKKHFPNINLNSTIADYATLGNIEIDGNNRLLVLFSTLPVVDSMNIVREFQKYKLQVSTIDVDVKNLHNVGNLIFENDLNGITDKLVLSINYQYSILNFISKGTLVYSREINFGVRDLLKPIQDKMQISEQDALKIIHEYGLRIPDDIYHRGQKLISSIEYNSFFKSENIPNVEELERSFQLAEQNFNLKINSILLGGAFANIRNSEVFIEDFLNTPTNFLNLKIGESIKTIDGKEIINISEENLDGDFINSIGMVIR